MIPISRPDIGAAEEEAVLEVLRSGMLAMGKKTEAFEQAWAAYCGVRHAIFMANGTLAQEAVLHGLGIGPGDEVITVSFSFNATANVDPAHAAPARSSSTSGPRTSTIDPDLVEAAITPRTKAIMPVHLYGLMADMDPLVAIAERHGLTIVEDAAQAHGAAYRGRRAGQFGTGDVQHFYATKNLTTGEGGFATTDDDALADRLRLFRNHGMRVPLLPRDRSARTTSRPTCSAPSGSPSWPGSTSGPRSGVPTPRSCRGRLPGTSTPTEPARPRARLAPVHDAVPRGADAGRGRPRRTGRRHAALLPRADPPAGIPPADHARCGRPRPAVTNQLVDEIVSIPVRPSLTDEELGTVVAAIREVATPSAELKPAVTQDRAS